MPSSWTACRIGTLLYLAFLVSSTLSTSFTSSQKTTTMENRVWKMVPIVESNFLVQIYNDFNYHWPRSQSFPEPSQYHAVYIDRHKHCIIDSNVVFENRTLQNDSMAWVGITSLDQCISMDNLKLSLKKFSKAFRSTPVRTRTTLSGRCRIQKVNGLHTEKEIKKGYNLKMSDCHVSRFKVLLGHTCMIWPKSLPNGDTRMPWMVDCLDLSFNICT